MSRIHEPRGAAPPDPGRTGGRPKRLRAGWQRPDVPRPAAPSRVPLPSPEATVPDLEIAEAATALDEFLALPAPVRRDLLAARAEGWL